MLSGGEKIRREPPVYNWEQKLTFERILCPASYKVVLSAYINIDDYYTFALKGNTISNLEWAVNKNNDVSNDPIIEFINVVLSWSDIIKPTRSGPAKYGPDIDVKSLEYDVFNTGSSVTNGKPWKVKDMGKVIGASEGKESPWVRVENSADTIHGHPISLDEFSRLTK
ncbi:hypothetical protein DBN05_004709 [Salmonella enterica subsp. enterica serovar Anderlecht]|nr:hypothetical protein [Salmonella enterica subsp. enterica serovar Anderlecht]EEJ3531213.1 hypothetical protein [Salmonella enterica subsp. enterica serovar Anderlecht]MIX10911.1 hypothetical protein [Salmonella enterica subsp. enterica serovar Anderlecht]